MCQQPVKLGDKGVLAIVCDSTNAMVEGHSGSELDVRRSLSALIRDLRGRVAVTCFASNVARMESVALAAQDAGRSVAIVGRSLRNMDAAARACGYLKTLPPFLTEDDIDDVFAVDLRDVLVGDLAVGGHGRVMDGAESILPVAEATATPAAVVVTEQHRDDPADADQADGADDQSDPFGVRRGERQ